MPAHPEGKEIAEIHDALNIQFKKLMKIYKRNDNHLHNAEGSEFNRLQEKVNKLDCAVDELRECLKTLRSI